MLGESNLCSENERYQLNWAGKSAAYHTLQAPTANTLAPCADESVNFADTQNLFIEAENLEALKILQKSYAGSVKMIYIDPPYNTGNDSFIYPDKFSESRDEYARRVGDKSDEGYLKRDGVFQGAWRKNGKDSGHYHSNWLSMMLPRLHLAKTLLRDDGVIFISIDDNEQAQLKLLCDEVFGAENFVAELVWSLGTGTQAGHFVRAHENILVYFKDKNLVPNFSGGDGLIEHSALKKISTKNPESNFTFPAGTRWDAPDGSELKGSWGGSEKMTLVDGIMKVQNGKLLHDVVLSAGYAQKKQMENWFSGNETFDTKGQRVLNFYFNKNGILRYEKERSIINPATVLNNIGSTKSGSDEINMLLGSQLFSFPKPSSLIKFFIHVTTSENDLILDFFSGSGTTAHAVMQLNAEDGGKRRYICVQLPEETDEKSEARQAGFATIAEIAKERIRRAGAQIAAAHPEQSPDTGFKVFKLTESNFKQWRSDVASDGLPDSLEAQMNMFIDPVAEHAAPENMAYELLLRLGLKLTARVRLENEVYWLEDEGRRVALLLSRVDEALLDALTAQRPDKVVALDRLFDGNDALKTNAVLQMKEADIVFATV